MRARIYFKIYYKVDIILIYLHPRSNHLREINQTKNGKFKSKSHLRGSGSIIFFKFAHIWG